MRAWWAYIYPTIVGRFKPTASKELVKARLVKGADKSIADSLKKEIKLMMSQYYTLAKLSNQLSVTFEMIKREIKEARGIIKKILQFDIGLMRLEVMLIDIESQIKRKVRRMKQSVGKIRDFEKHASKNIYAVALGIASDLNYFAQENADAGIAMSNFNAGVRRIVAVGFKMASLTEAYERIVKGLADANQAVDDCVDILIKVVQAILTDPQMKIDEEEASKILEQLRKQLDYEGTIDRYLSNVERAVKYRLRYVYSLIDNLVAEDARVVQSIKASSAKLGQMIALQVNKKINIDTTHVGQLRQFEKDLEKINANAYTGYVQARRAQAFAVA